VFRTIRIRTKLGVALALPLTALVAAAGFEAVDASADASDAREQAQLATASVGPTSLAGELQNERNYSALDLLGLADTANLDVGSVELARVRVDAAIDDLRELLDGERTVVREAFEPAIAALDDLEVARGIWDDHVGPKDVTNQPLAEDLFARYTQMTEAFFDATAHVALEVDHADLRNGLTIVEASARRDEAVASLTQLIVLDMLTEGDSVTSRLDAASLVGRIAGFEETVRVASVGPYQGLFEGTLDQPWDLEARQLFASFLAGDSVDVDAVLTAVSGGTGEFVSAGERGDSILNARADEIVADADLRRWIVFGVAGGVLALALLLTWLASRSITRPLRSLGRQAEHMASETLPAAVREIQDTPAGEDVLLPALDPIKVKTRDEVREVAAALTAVQRRAVDLAVEQALLRRNIGDSFVNLGRRNQNLLNRQLDLITELEQRETDPDDLDSLFKLDHLATRMRRNAESLLVLAGIDAPRQWAQPVAVADVVRSACGEVEDYHRVTTRYLEPASLTGSVAADVAHVLAELIENALVFSPPAEAVEVKGRLTPSGYTVAVTDNGMGMSAAELERSNRRLAGGESFTVAPSKYLGHYVAGHLAARHGIRVDLQDSPAGGIVARVVVPLTLVNDAAQPADEPVHESFDSLHAAEEPVPSEQGPEPVPAVAANGVDDEPARHLARRDRVAEAATPGFGGLARTAAPERAGEGAGSTGLARRVPGAQRPDTAPLRARRAPQERDGDADDGATSRADDVYSFLSSFVAGVERGRAGGDRPVDDRGASDTEETVETVNVPEDERSER
jgi:signal transduction histidine kinase